MPPVLDQSSVAARTNQIIDAAATVFATKGFHATTIHDIAQHAGVADGTIYNYFDNKAALLIGIFDRMRSNLMAQVQDTPPSSDPETFVRDLVLHPLMNLKQDNFALFRIVVAELMTNDEIRRLFHEQILAPMLDGAETSLYMQPTLHHGANSNPLVTRFIGSVILGIALECVIGDRIVAERWDELPDTFARFLVKGIFSPEAAPTNPEAAT